MAAISSEELQKGGANMYEICVSAAKEARKRNEFQRLKRNAGEMDDQEIPVKVTVEVLLDMMEGRGRCVNPGNRRKR
ncbi:MAG: hypothetical protein V1800_19045 [Candidatus Latescibacterota bacterium]